MPMKWIACVSLVALLAACSPLPAPPPVEVQPAYIGGGDIDCWTGTNGYLEAAYLGPMGDGTYDLMVVPFRAGHGTDLDPYYTPIVYYQVWNAPGVYHWPQCWANTPIAWSENPPGYGYSSRDVRNIFSSGLGTANSSVWLHVWNATAVLHGQPGEECWYKYASDPSMWSVFDGSCSFYYLLGGPSF